MTLQSKLLTCHCLNVQLIVYDHQCEQSSKQQWNELLEHNDNDNDLEKFLLNSKLMKIIPGGIKINYEYLCLKRIIDNLQINFCAICESDTHAVVIINQTTKSSSLLNNKLMMNNENDESVIAFVNMSLMNYDNNDEKSIKLSKNFSPALGIVLPKNNYENNGNEIMKKSSNDNNDNGGYYLISNSIQENISDKIRTYLKQEKFMMQERIKSFTIQQENEFKNLFHKTLNNKQTFLRMIESIKIRHNIDDNNNNNNNDDNNNNDNDNDNNKDYDNNKENENNSQRQQQRQRRSIDSFVEDKNSIEDVYYNNKMTPSKKMSTTTELLSNAAAGKNSDEFDSIFDIDDLDENRIGGESSSMESFRQRQVDDDLDVDLNEECRDNVFPLKESQQQHNNNEFNMFMNEDDNDEPLNGASNNGVNINNNNNNNNYRNKRNISSSLATHHHHLRQQKNHFYRGQNNDDQNINNNYSSSSQQMLIANSLPIQIPHLARRHDREIEESFRINPGESMAESIQKMARSVRNEIDILDDRPRRRLNTCDLIKSRKFY